jgi:hypothetical protein
VQPGLSPRAAATHQLAGTAGTPAGNGQPQTACDQTTRCSTTCSSQVHNRYTRSATCFMTSGCSCVAVEMSLVLQACCSLDG